MIIRSVRSTLKKSIDETLKDLNTITVTIVEKTKERLLMYLENLVLNWIRLNETVWVLFYSFTVVFQEKIYFYFYFYLFLQVELTNFVKDCFDFLKTDFARYKSQLTFALRNDLITLIAKHLPDNVRFYRQL